MLTEADWLKWVQTGDVGYLFRCALMKNQTCQTPRGRRKLRLLAAACCRLVLDVLPEERYRLAVEAAEKYADGRCKVAELKAVYEAAYPAWEEDNRSMKELCAVAASPGAKQMVRADLLIPMFLHNKDRSDLIPEIFGNPFRPVAVNPLWRTPDVLALANAAYDERILPSRALDPARLAVLADALTDAGCDSADLLDHLRSPGPHVRGCFAVDLLLGKS